MADAAHKPRIEEAEINAPSIQTLIMLGVMSLATLIFWAAGRAACNYHVPGESLTPRQTTVEERTRFPKSVGIEFSRAVRGGDFELAKELSEGEARSWVIAEAAKCGGECSERVSVRDEVLAVGVVERGNSVDSIVRVTTSVDQEQSQEQVMGIERVGRKWRVTRIYPDVASSTLKEAPVRGTSEPPMTRGRPAAPPSSSQMPPHRVP